jgi:hypothetical protein
MRHAMKVATVTLLMAVLASGVVAGRLRRDGPSQNRIKIVNMLTEGRKLAIEAGELRKEAIAGRIPDKSAPRDEDGKRKSKWIELKQSERLSRFAKSKSKLAAAINKAAEAEAFLKKHPNVALDATPATIKEKWTDEYARTVVAEARFRMAEEIGKLADWKRLATQALKINKDCIEAQRLNEEIKTLEEEMKKEAEAKRKAAAEKRKEDARKRKEAAAEKAEAAKDAGGDQTE